MEEGVISTGTLVMIEFVFFFGLLLAFCAWQLISLKRDARRAAEREAAEAEAESQARPEPPSSR